MCYSVTAPYRRYRAVTDFKTRVTFSKESVCCTDAERRQSHSVSSSSSGELARVVAVPDVDDTRHARLGHKVSVVAHEGLGRVEHVGMLTPTQEVDGVEAQVAVDEVDGVGEAVVATLEGSAEVGVDALAEVPAIFLLSLLPVVGLGRVAIATASGEAGEAGLGGVARAVALDAEVAERLVQHTPETEMSESPVPAVRLAAVKRVGLDEQDMSALGAGCARML